MKQLFLWLVCYAWATAACAQRVAPAKPAPAPVYVVPSRWTPHVDSIFQHLDRSLVGTGLLVNYGVALKDFAPFQGSSLNSANLLRGLAEWRLLYGAMQTSRYNANATLPTLAAMLSLLSSSTASFG